MAAITQGKEIIFFISVAVYKHYEIRTVQDLEIEAKLINNTY